VGPDPHLQAPDFHFVEFPLPTDSGHKTALAKTLYALIDPAPELLFWIGDWAVWPSCQHMPLFSRFREAFGEPRPLIEVPGHVLQPHEAADALSLLILSLLFFWDCHVLTASGRDALFVSHDEYGWFASRDSSVVRVIKRQLQERSRES
jgi:hypothetical protein